MKIEEAIKCAMDGDSVLFLGAGFSFGGINKNREEIQTGSGLAHKLCDEMKIERCDDLTITSARYVDDPTYGKGLPALITFLKNELICTTTLDFHETIINLPWKRIYTTNYDNIIEKATENVKRNRESITATSKRYTSGIYLEEAIIHINGMIINLNEDKFIEEFKITDENYVKDGFLESPWSDLFKTDLEKAKAIVFIGYSLDYDQNIKNMLARLRIKYKCVFIDIPSINDNAAYRLNKYGELYKIGASGFAKEIIEVQKIYSPSVKIIELNGFEQITSDYYYTSEKHTSKDVIDLLVKGKVCRKYINQDGYCIKREKKVNEAIEALETNKILIICSNLGNGKTVFLECMANKLCKEKNVYLVNNLDTMYEDLELVLSNSEKENILIIDDYGYYIKLLQELAKAYPDNLKLVLTCRTTINVNLYYDLINKYKYDEKEIAILDINQLIESEIQETVKLLDLNRLWGNHDKESNSQKKSLIKKKFHANISSVFYLLLESEQISKEVNSLLNEVFEKEGLRNFVFAQSINSICNLKLKFYDICKFINISETTLNKYGLDLKVKEIIDFDKGSMGFTSSIFSQYIINQDDFLNQIMEILIKIYIESEKGEFNNKYKIQRKMLISRSNIKLILSTKGILTETEEYNMFNYFDKIKNTKTASENPFFWLQFGITVINLKMYDLADIYIKNAYTNISLLDNFDAYQLDTHKARLLLNRELDTNRNHKERALNSFKEAHKLLMNNSNSGKNLIYVLKQTRTYLKYFNTYLPLFCEKEKENFLKTAYEINIKYQFYFKIADMKKLPYEAESSYLEYRKLFNKTKYAVEINNLDKLFNAKTSNKHLSVPPLSIL